MWLSPHFLPNACAVLYLQQLSFSVVSKTAFFYKPFKALVSCFQPVHSHPTAEGVKAGFMFNTFLGTYTEIKK